MSDVEYIDHTELATSTMPPLWRDKPNATGLIEAIADSFQPIEDIFKQLKEERDLYTAIGEQLDVLGILLEEPREGRLDPAYRTALLAKASAKGASGTISDIKRISRIITGAEEVRVFNHYPACTYIFINSVVSYEEALAIDEAHMAGVRTRIMWSHELGFISSDGQEVLDFTSVECGEETVEAGADNAECGIDEVATAFGGGFTSLPPITEPHEYSVIDDQYGFMCAISSDSPAVYDTGYLINEVNDYIIDNTGDNIRYIQ